MSSWEVLVIVLAGIDIVFRLIALVIVPRNRRPQTSMAWLLAIFFIPFVAFFAFLAFGSHKLSPTRIKKQHTINAVLRANQSELPSEVRVSADDLVKASTVPAEHRQALAALVSMNEALGHMSAVRGNEIDFFDDYAGSLEAMIRDIEMATSTVHVEFYIMSVDEVTEPFFAALEQATKRGVTVRVLFDQVATARIPGSPAVGRRLRQAGIGYHAMLPFQPWRGVYQRPDLRNHRKILVIDSTVSYTGSQNIIEPGYRRRGSKGLWWMDLMARIEGPLVNSLESLFVTDWFHETGTVLELPTPGNEELPGSTWAQLVPSGPAFDGENNLRMFNSLMYQARTHITIVSPYLVPDDSMRYAITSAALRGVRVDVYVSEVGDQALVFYAQRSYYQELLSAGVNIWLYPAPTVLHSKFLVIDSAIAVMGTSNLDMRSFSLNLELSLLLLGPEVIDQLEKLADSYREVSTQLTPETWESRGQTTRFIEGLARLTATVQ